MSALSTLLLSLIQVSTANASDTILRFAHISDAHVCDSESPGRMIRANRIVEPSWRPQEAFGAQLLDGMVRAVNREHRRDPFSFVIHGGDAVDNNQWNELRWFLDTMDGDEVHADSGDDDDAVPGPGNDSGDPFDAEGVAPELPWYQVFGNHDGFVLGNFTHWVARSLLRLNPLSNWSWAVVEHSADVILPKRTRPGRVPADDRRRWVTAGEFMTEHFNTRSLPVGHGFTEDNLRAGRGNYVFRVAAPGAAFKVISLDTTNPEGLAMGYFPEEEWKGFVEPELADAERQGELVIVATHHPSGDLMPFGPRAAVGPKEFRKRLQDHPSVVLHLAGHTHRNEFYDHRVAGAGYVELVTGAIINFPHEGRALELSMDDNGGLNLRSRMIQIASSRDSLVREGLRRAMLELKENGGHLDPRKMLGPDEARDFEFKLR